MHYHCEIILPPTDNAEKAIESILQPFSENDEESYRPFWDWYQIGGRWSGEKILASIPKDRREEFEKWMREQETTVSGLQFGKQTLAPSSQIEKIDAKWREMFPETGLQHCPFFDHAGKSLAGDIATLAQTPRNLTCERIIFSGPSYNGESKTWDGPLEATFMLSQSVWNGTNHEKTTWAGTVQHALELFEARFANYNPEYAMRMKPADNWLVATVDYHS